MRRTGTGRSDDDVAGPSKSGCPDPLPATVFGPDDTEIVDKAGNIRLDTLNSRKIGQAFNAEQIQAARKLLIQSDRCSRAHAGRLSAWAGLDLRGYIAGEVLRCPAQGAERVKCRVILF